MTKLVVLIGFCVAFAAGLTVGMSRHGGPQASSPATQLTSRPSHRGFLPSELNLSADQQEQLSKIWSETARGGRGEQDDRRRQLRQKRDETIASLIRPEDKDKYEQAIKDYGDQTSAMDREMRDRFKKAVEATKQLLTPEQRTKYEEILSRHSFGQPGGSPGRGRGDSNRNDGGRGDVRDRESTTRRSEPANDPSNTAH